MCEGKRQMIVGWLKIRAVLIIGACSEAPSFISIIEKAK